MILILGLGGYVGGSGSSAAFYYAKQGVKVVVTDLKTEAELHQPTLKKLKKYNNVELVLGKHRKQDIKEADLIIRNPGVPETSPYVKYARSLKKVITNDVGVFLSEIRNKYHHSEVAIVGITGTRGKSTTTALIGYVLSSQFKNRVHIGGNIGNSPLNFLSKVKPGHIVVLELSSWMLHDLYNPMLNVAVVTNLLRDHMNYYKSMAVYRKDKERIFLGQTKDCFAVVNQHDRIVKQMAKTTKAELIWFNDTKKYSAKLLGKHNQSNINAAYQVSKIFGVTETKFKQVIKKFPGVPNRLELVRQYKKRLFYNDTTATTPDATIAALNSFKKKVILIAGGNSKNLPLKDMRKAIKKQVKTLILLPGNANHDFPKGEHVADMKAAVNLAWVKSKPGDIILLSPGVTWLPLMNEFARGDEFVKWVKKIN